MLNILALLQCLKSEVSGTTLRQMSRIILAMLAMSGRVTMLGISRWAGKGGSYRTVVRWFSTTLPWASLFWVFFEKHLFNPKETYLLAGDEVVVTKAGKKTYGVGRFFSGLQSQPVPGLSFFALSLVSIEQRRAFPIRVEQMLRPAAAAAAAAAEAAAAASPSPPEKRGPGRPKGVKTKDKRQVVLNREQLHISAMLDALLRRFKGVLPLTYLLLDGHFGTNGAVQMARRSQLHIISKLRHDSRLFLPYVNPQPGKPSRNKYGDRLDYRNLPAQFLCESTTDDDVQTDTYQITVLHPELADPLNVVILVRTHLKTQAQGHVILFSSDLTLTYDLLIDYYSLRFQIEFNFRDAKQFWGLEDFMNVTQTGVTNAANLAFFMVNLSHPLLADVRLHQSDFSTLDLKAYWRGHKYLDEIVKLLPEIPEPILLKAMLDKVTSLGCIHPRTALPETA